MKGNNTPTFGVRGMFANPLTWGIHIDNLLDRRRTQPLTNLDRAFGFGTLGALFGVPFGVGGGFKK